MNEQERPLGLDSKYLYAGFWLRFWAHLIDNAIIGFTLLLLVILLSLPFIKEIDLDKNPYFFTNLYLLTWPIPVWLYYALMESSRLQGTIGKMVLGLKVTDLSGKRISFLRATVRFFAKILSWLILGIGYLMIGWTKRKQGLHDMIAGCLIIRKNPVSRLQ